MVRTSSATPIIKKVLALYTKESDIKNIKKNINTNSNFVCLRKYNSKNLLYIIDNFLHNEEVLEKFNFIASDKILNYLDWLVIKNGRKSRSDVLRDLINNQIINYDEEY